MTNTENEIEEMKDELYNTALTLEEMIVCQEGLLPKRVLDPNRTKGYHDARKQVLNEARTQLRRVKTFMLRAGVLKPAQPQAERQGEHNANVEKAPARPPAPAQRVEWPKKSWFDLVSEWFRK